MSLQTNVDTFINWIKRSGLDVKPHQLSGIRWCLSREHNNKPLHLTSQFDIDDTDKGEYIPPIAGGILGDEMGLGKTILMIGAIIANPKKALLLFFLIVLLSNGLTFLINCLLMTFLFLLSITVVG